MSLEKDQKLILSSSSNPYKLPKILGLFLSDVSNIKNPPQINIREVIENRRKRQQLKSELRVNLTETQIKRQEIKRKIKLNLQRKIQKIQKLMSFANNHQTQTIIQNIKKQQDQNINKYRLRPLTPLKILQKEIMNSKKQLKSKPKILHKSLKTQQQLKQSRSTSNLKKKYYHQSINSYGNKKVQQTEKFQYLRRQKKKNQITYRSLKKQLNIQNIKIQNQYQQIKPWNFQSYQNCIEQQRI